MGLEIIQQGIAITSREDSINYQGLLGNRLENEAAKKSIVST
jgi:hypothetical protein